jgi:hypothetical protein
MSSKTWKSYAEERPHQAQADRVVVMLDLAGRPFCVFRKHLARPAGARPFERPRSILGRA